MQPQLLIQTLQFIALCGYTLHVILQIRLVRSDTPYTLHWLFVAIVIAHLASLIVSVHQGIFGLYTAFSSFAWISALVGLLLARKTPVILLWCAPLAMVALMLDASLRNSYTISSSNAVALVFHTIVAMLAFAFSALSSVLLVIHRIKRMHVRRLDENKWSHIPPLEVLEKSAQTTLFAALVCLGIAIASGFVFVDDFLSQKLAHKTFFTIIAWLLLLCVWIGKSRHSLGWQGQLRFSIAATGLLVIGYFGSRVVIELLLR